jgi:hypothetical protein
MFWYNFQIYSIRAFMQKHDFDQIVQKNRPIFQIS